MIEKLGVISTGIKLPIIREGDDLVKIIRNNVLDAMTDWTGSSYIVKDNAVVGITESIVARAQGNYVTVDEIVDEIVSKYGRRDIVLLNPIYSRNRFSVILKALARAANNNIHIIMPEFDEVGNPCGVNQFTSVNIEEYYKEIVESEDKICFIIDEKVYESVFRMPFDDDKYLIIDCRLHSEEKWNCNNVITLKDICHDKCEYGLLGSNKSTDEKLKLFPNKAKAQQFVEDLQKELYKATAAHIIVTVYGDGCFKDPVGGIWEFADPVTMPAYTDKELIESTPNELKVKALADDKFKDLNGQELMDAMKQEIENKEKNLVGSMKSQGTTPRMYRDLLASLMDLTSGSGDRCTPVVLIQNYFNR